MNDFFNKLLIGLGMIAVGILFLLNQMNWTHFDLGGLLTTYWPVFIIYLGIRGLLFQKNRVGGSFIWSIFIMFLGGYFLLNNLGVEGFSYDKMYKYIVPVLLIMFGLKILFRDSKPKSKGNGADWWGTDYADRQIRKHERKLERQEMRSHIHTMKEEMYQAKDSLIKDSLNKDGLSDQIHKESKAYYDEVYKKTENDWNKGKKKYNYNAKVSRSSFIGDVHYGQDDWDLTPLDISQFIGDTVIDLTKATIPLGETRINVSSFIGDLKIYIPNDMQIEVSVTASAFISDLKVLDRYESGLFKNLHTQTRDYNDADKKIRINVSTFIGDVIVKRVG